EACFQLTFRYSQLKPEYRRIRDKPYLFMQEMTDLCGSTTATGSHSFGSNQPRPPRPPVRLFGSDQPVPTSRQHLGRVRTDVDSQSSMPSRWSTSRLSDASQYEDDVAISETQFTYLLVRGTGTSWEDVTEDEPPMQLTPGGHQQPRSESPPHTGGSTSQRRESVFEDEAVSPHKPTSSRRLSTGQRQRRAKQPMPPQQTEIALPEPMIDYMNMCQDRYQREIAHRHVGPGSSSTSVEEEADIEVCVDMLTKLPGLPQEKLYPAITLFDLTSNRR